MAQDSPSLSHVAQLRRARLLYEQSRYPEAADAFRRTLSITPEDAEALVGLAFCLCHSDNPDDWKEGVATIDRALAVDPESSPACQVRALLLARLRRFPDAHEAADAAIALAPDEAGPHGAKAHVFIAQEFWAKAEAAARTGLTRDPENGGCSAALATALLMQGKAAGHAETIARQLKRDPEDPHAHFNMGLAALRAGRRRDAEKHLRESLRLDPSFDGARSALLEAFRARSPLYNGFLRLSFQLARLSPQVRIAVLIGAYLAYRAAYVLTRERAPTVAAALAILWVSFALFSFLGRGLGNLIILADSTARLALRAKDRWEGVIVGGLLVTGVVLVAASLVTGIRELGIAGGCAIAPAVPASVAFGADRPAGRKLYGSAAAILAICSLGAVAGTAASASALVDASLAIGIPIFIASAWAAMFGFKTD